MTLSYSVSVLTSKGLTKIDEYKTYKMAMRFALGRSKETNRIYAVLIGESIAALAYNGEPFIHMPGEKQ